MVKESLREPADEPSPPSLYILCRKNPEGFADALARQIELDVCDVIGRPLQPEDREVMREIARNMCFHGYWRFEGNLLFLIRCGVTAFLARNVTKLIGKSVI